MHLGGGLLGAICVPIFKQDTGLLFTDNTELAGMVCTVELQWPEHIWDHENQFETGLVQASEG